MEKMQEIIPNDTYYPNNLPRFTIVEYREQKWILENFSKRKPVLMRQTKEGKQIGLEIKWDTMLRVVKYPSSLAWDYIIDNA